MPELPGISELSKFDPEMWTEQECADRREAIRLLLEPLSRRAIIVFALRCAKRTEPFAQIQLLIAEAYSTGLDISNVRQHVLIAADANSAVTSASRAAEAASVSDDVNSVAAALNASDASTCAASLASSDTAVLAAITAAEDTDAKKLRSLNLGQPGSSGEPIRWNDRRLGPLWPNGEPQWYTEAVRACRELEEKLRTLPQPNAPSADTVLEAQIEDRDWLDHQLSEGKLSKYRGEYIIAAEKQIFAHGRDLAKINSQAEKKAKARGIRSERLVLYFVPGQK